MDITILIPHYKTLEITAFAIYKFLKHKGSHNVKIIVIDNSYPDESIKSLEPFKDQITIVNNTSTKIQSHGVAFDFAMPMVETDYFMCAESDSFPVKDGWLDYYQKLIENGFTWGGSLLKLSGGTFIHPTGSFYKTEYWHEAKKYCDEIQYSYFPNCSRHTDFDCHLMVHDKMLEYFLDHPNACVQLSQQYNEKPRDYFLERKDHYSPMVAPFHNGMGNLNESLYTYGQRDVGSEAPEILLKNKEDFINKIGYEPGQWLCYWLIAMQKHGCLIPTEIKWMRNRGWQQQEYTVNEAGFLHAWCGSSFYSMEGGELNDVYEFKKKQIEDFYSQMPSEFKV